MSDKTLSVIIGGLVTLLVTFIVQAFVIPRVQVRGRRRERWEKDAIELAGIVEEQLPRVLNGYRSACLGPWILLRSRDDPDLLKPSAKELIDKWQTERREADKVVGETLARVNVLERRIRQVRPHAPYWRQLEQRQTALRFALFKVDIWWIDEDAAPDDDAWRDAWELIDNTRKQLFATVLQVADRPKPPPRRIISRLRSTAPKKLRALRDRMNPMKWFNDKTEPSGGELSQGSVQ